MEQRILQSLLSPSAYPDTVTTVHLVQTHVSFIFVTDNFVYKIKKPVDFGFLNFTTLDRRRFYCNEEVRLNGRLCPDMYRGVVEVRDSPAGVRIDGEGTVIDYAVKMKRLPEERMFDRLVREEKVTDDQIRQIARTIGAFHLEAEQGKEIESYGSTANIRQNWDDNFQQIAEFPPPVISRRDLDIVRDWAVDYLSVHDALFAERIAQGFIRDCDGDIHMGNICLADRVYIFDCIEFNSRFRYSDTAADIAFLLMDFDYHGRHDYGGIFLSEYIAATGDRDVVKLLDFYKTYRAVVRGKVAGLKSLDPDVPVAERRSAEEEAARYFLLARGYVLRRRLTPSLIITCGLMGSGKSSIASALAFELGTELHSSDLVRKEIAQVPKFSHQSSGYGEGIYSPVYTEATYDMLLTRADRALDAGRSVIIDATFHRRPDRTRFRELAAQHSVPFRIIVASCPEDVIQERLAEREKALDVVSDGRWELFRKQAEHFELPGDEEGRLTRVDTSLPFRMTIDSILGSMELL